MKTQKQIKEELKRYKDQRKAVNYATNPVWASTLDDRINLLEWVLE